MNVRTIALLIATALPPAAAERPMFLPFDVTLGGQKAALQQGNGLFATIAKPVKPDAMLALDAPVPMLIVNAFPCAEDGSVQDGQPAAVIFAQNTQEVKLDATMDKKALKPGIYLANIVANSATACIVFSVGEPEAKADFSKILSFLKKKAGVE